MAWVDTAPIWAGPAEDAPRGGVRLGQDAQHRYARCGDTQPACWSSSLGPPDASFQHYSQQKSRSRSSSELQGPGASRAGPEAPRSHRRLTERALLSRSALHLRATLAKRSTTWTPDSLDAVRLGPRPPRWRSRQRSPAGSSSVEPPRRARRARSRAWHRTERRRRRSSGSRMRASSSRSTRPTATAGSRSSSMPSPGGGCRSSTPRARGSSAPPPAGAWASRAARSSFLESAEPSFAALPLPKLLSGSRRGATRSAASAWRGSATSGTPV